MPTLSPPVWLLCTVLWLACGWTVAAWAEDAPRRVFLIGNSLTWDTLPPLLGESVEWHVDCGKNLAFIYEHPQQPCVKSSILWPDALEAKQYDTLCVQPHFGTTLEDDVEVISHWLKLQPAAKLVIHTGWNRHRDFEAAFHTEGPFEQMVHAPGYFEELVGQLEQRFPATEICTTGVCQVLDEIYHDIQKSQAPFQAFSELYRDEIHLDHHIGRYLAHNLMRVALDLPLSAQGFQIDDAHRRYFDAKIEAHRAGTRTPALPGQPREPNR